MDSGACVGTTAPFWVFTTMVNAGVLFAQFATMLVALSARPGHLDRPRGQLAGIGVVLAGNLLFYAFLEYTYRGGWEGVLTFAAQVGAGAIPWVFVVVLVLARRSSAKRGLELRGRWRRVFEGTRLLAAAGTVVSGVVTSSMVWVQVLSLRPC